MVSLFSFEEERAWVAECSIMYPNFPDICSKVYLGFEMYGYYISDIIVHEMWTACLFKLYIVYAVRYVS